MRFATTRPELQGTRGSASLAFVEIQLAIQQEYEFTIPDEDAQSITTVGEAIDYSNRRLREQEG